MKETEKAFEAYLVAGARGGDRGAMDRLIRLRGPRLMAHAARLLGDAEAARDVAQDAWVEIFRGLGGLRDARAFLPWALRIVSRRVARLIARRQRDRKLAVQFGQQSVRATPEAGPGASDAARVRRAIAGLPPGQAAVVALFYLEEMRVAEVAVAMDLPIGTIKTRLMHARAWLRDELERKHDGKT